jgi:hypothetical protein
MKNIKRKLKMLIDLEQLETKNQTHKETIWDIENYEKIQFADFIQNRIMSKVNKIIDEKNAHLVELENKLSELKTEIAKIENKIIEIPDICVPIRLSGEYVRLSGNEFLYNSSVVNNYIPINCEELSISKFSQKDDMLDVIWEQISAFYKLKKLTINYKYIRIPGLWHDGSIIDVEIDNKIIRKIKNKYLKELCITPQTPNFEDSLEILLNNFPELEILEINYPHAPSIPHIAEKLSSLHHKIKTIRLVRQGYVKFVEGTITYLETMEKYCKDNNIILVY